MNHIPVITLTNGLRVANFSSPHPFTFTDGSVLPACSKERAQALMLDVHEYEVVNHATQMVGDAIVSVPYQDIVLEWNMSQAVMDELERLQYFERIGIVLVPLSVMTAMKASRLPIGKCRVIRVADRVTKTIHIDRFCR